MGDTNPPSPIKGLNIKGVGRTQNLVRYVVHKYLKQKKAKYYGHYLAFLLFTEIK